MSKNEIIDELVWQLYNSHPIPMNYMKFEASKSMYTKGDDILKQNIIEELDRHFIKAVNTGETFGILLKDEWMERLHPFGGSYIKYIKREDSWFKSSANKYPFLSFVVVAIVSAMIGGIITYIVYKLLL